MKSQLSRFYVNSIADDGNIVGDEKAASVFARGMDDFIFITTERSKALDFLHQMHSGFPEYNCVIQGTSKPKVSHIVKKKFTLSARKYFVQLTFE